MAICAPRHNGVAVSRPLPKRPMSLAKTIELLEQALDNLEDTACTFWACDGPQHPRHMITCTRCWGIRDLQRALRHLRARNQEETP